MKRNNNVVLKIGMIIFILAGLCVTFSFEITKAILKLDSKANAYDVEIIEREDTDSDGNTIIQYSPVFYYKVNNVDYTCKSSFSSSVKPKVNKKTIYYNSNDPSKCFSKWENGSNKFWGILFVVVGCICAVIFFKRDN